MRYLLGIFLLGVSLEAAHAAAPPAGAGLERLHQIVETERLTNSGALLYQQAKLNESEKTIRRVLAMRQRLYPVERYPDGHLSLIASLTDLGFLLKTLGRYAAAEPYYRQALEMAEKLFPPRRYPQGQEDLAEALKNLGSLLHAKAEYEKAEPYYRQSLQMYQRLYPKDKHPRGHPEIAEGLNNLGRILEAQGELTRAEPYYERCLAMFQELYPKARYSRGHPNLAQSLNDLGLLAKARGDYGRGESLLRDTLRMRQSLYPRNEYPLGNLGLAQSLNNLAIVLQDQGEYAKAAPFYQLTLEMIQKIYPKDRHPQGHPHIAEALDNMAHFLRSHGQLIKAERFYSQALEMRLRLFPIEHYPLGHPAVDTSRNNMGLVLASQGKLDKAEPYLRKTLEITEQRYPKERYPNGHPTLATSLNNLGMLYFRQREFDKAEKLFGKSIKMLEKLYPKERYPNGHRNLANALGNMGALLLAHKEYARGELYLRRAVEMEAGISAALAASVPEAQALNYTSTMPLTRDSYLSLTGHLPKSDPYPVIWRSKANLSRVYERRHLALLAGASDKIHCLWEEIRSLRRQRERLLLAPAAPDRTRQRDKQIDDLDEKITANEKELLPLLPALKRSDELARATPAKLRKALPDGTVLIDFLRYTRFDPGEEGPGKKTNPPTLHYLAFVVTRDTTVRVELGEAKLLEETVRLWRKAISENAASQLRYAPEVSRLVWQPLTKHLPEMTTRVYLSPDMDLSRLPWAALPGKRKGSILLEDYSLAVVPHGPYLLDKLTASRQKTIEKEIVLGLGGVAYDKAPATNSEIALRGPVPGKEESLWPSLPGTTTELTHLRTSLSGRRLIALSGNRASSQALIAELPRANVAHLATHGFFADKQFRSLIQLDEKLFAQTRFMSGRGTAERIGAGARSPMILSGLVCAGANLKDTPNRGIVTADAIVGLDLRKLNLAVLSACETGLGDVAGGEGVYGLQRAFHIAGCRNVVASLWKVDDEATAALMVLFYKGLWGKEKITPMEALRRAQVALYREPERVKEWAAGRGPNPKRIVPVSKDKPPEKGTKTCPAKAWAAFVISGPGD